MTDPAEKIDRTAQEIAKVAVFPTHYASQQIMEVLETTGEAVRLLVACIRYILTSGAVWLDSISHMGMIGVNSLALVIVTVTCSGAVLSLYSSVLLVKWGLSSYMGGGVGLSIVRELGPVLAAVVVTARAGSAMAAELGSMKVTEQIDALRSLSINHIQYLVAPRFLACIVVFPMLTVFANFAGTVGGYLVAVTNGVPSGVFIESMGRFLTGYDLSMGLVKSIVFGATVAIICCQQGLRTRGGATGVGRSTTNGVVISIVLIYVFNFFLAWLMFGERSSVS